MAAVRRPDVIPNQVFVGCPWSVTLPKYEKVIDKLKSKYPLYFAIVGREGHREAKDLLNEIKERIDSSSYALFDATSGNPNVSLEFGYAEARGLRRAIYLSTHKASNRADRDSPIITDLASKARNNYKRVSGLQDLLEEFCRQHDYTKRFEVFHARRFRKAEKKKKRAMTLSLIHAFDGKPQMRRGDIVHELRKGCYNTDEIADLIKRMRKARFLRKSKSGFTLA